MKIYVGYKLDRNKLNELFPKLKKISNIINNWQWRASM